MNALETVRLRLDPLRVEHAAAMFDGLSNLRLYEFLAEEPPASVEWLAARYARLESRLSPRGDEHWLNWVLLDKEGLEARGYVQATVSGLTATVAYVLFEEAWGRGLAREAMAVVLSHLSGAYGVTDARATVDPRNLRSVRLLEGTGFFLSHIREGAEWIHGVLTAEAIYVRGLDGVL